MHRAFLLAAAFALASCATTKPPPVSDAAMRFWPLAPGGDCDFEDPDRGAFWLVTTSPFQLPMPQRRASPPSSFTYVVRDGQLLAPTRAGDRFCLSLLRGLSLRSKQAAFGFHGRVLSATELELTPAYSRVSRAIHSSRTDAETSVRIAFGAGWLVSGPVEPSGSVEFELGVVQADGQALDQPASQPGVLRLPARRDGGIVRIVAVIEEGATRVSAPVSPELLSQTLNQVDIWD